MRRIIKGCPPVLLTVSGLAVLVALSACGAPPSGETLPESRTAQKTTCPEVTLASDLAPLDRKLVPYSADLLGVETTFGDGDKRVRLISGGYLDDAFEPYDDMTEFGSMTIRNSEALLLSSSLLGKPVWAAVWREAVDPPCDAHAIIATGLSDQEFLTQLGLLR